MQAIKMLKTRKSDRKFLPYSIDLNIVEDIIDCARLSASAKNVQPWHFVVIDDAQIKSKIAQLAKNGAFIQDCGVCVAVFCQDGEYAQQDGSAATQNILNAATAYDLGSCWVAGYNKSYSDAVAELLQAPKDYKLISLVAIGIVKEKTARVDKKPLAKVMSYNKFE